MSFITDVVLFCSILDNDAGTIEHINHWLGEKDHSHIKETMLSGIWCGSFNRGFNIQEFTDFLLTLDWYFADNVQVMIKDEHDEQFTLWQMGHLRKNGIPHTFWTKYPDY